MSRVRVASNGEAVEQIVCIRCQQCARAGVPQAHIRQAKHALLWRLANVGKKKKMPRVHIRRAKHIHDTASRGSHAKHSLGTISHACRVAYENIEQNNELTLNIRSLKCHATDVNHDTTVILKLNFVSVNGHRQQLRH